MNPKLEETIYVDFITSSPTTGAATDADSTPTCEVFEDANDTGIITPTPAKRTGKTGDYRVQIDCTAANGFETSKSYNVVVSATVGGIAAKSVVSSFQMRTRCIDDVMPTYTQPSGFLAAIFSGTIANTTNITAGTITTVTNLTNAPTNGDFTSDMKTSLDNATPVVTVSDKTGFSLTAAYDPAKTAAQAGDAMTLTAGERTSIGTAVWASATRTLTTFGTLIADIWDSASRTLTAFAFTVDTNANATETAIKERTDNLPDNPAATGDAMTLTAGERTSVGTAVWASATRTLTSFGTLVSDVATAVWGAAARTLTVFGFTVDTNANATETAIQAKTDQLVFTVANQVDANTQSINDTTITGDGQPGTEFGV